MPYLLWLLSQSGEHMNPILSERVGRRSAEVNTAAVIACLWLFYLGDV